MTDAESGTLFLLIQPNTACFEFRDQAFSISWSLTATNMAGKLLYGERDEARLRFYTEMSPF